MVDLRLPEEGFEEVVITSSTGDLRRVPFEHPFTEDELARLLGDLEERLRRDAEDDRRPSAVGASDGVVTGGVGDEEDAPDVLGGRLFDVLVGSEGDDPLRTALRLAHERSSLGRPTGVRIRLRFSGKNADLGTAPDAGSARLAALPWELLYRALDGDRPGLAPGHSLVRHIDIERGVREVRSPPPLRVLVVEAAPRGDLDLAEEPRRIRRSVAENPAIELHDLAGADLGRLREAARSSSCQVVHFLGRGGFDRNGEASLLFEDERGREKPVPAGMLVDHLKGLPHLGLVVLDACGSGAPRRRPGVDPVKGVAAALARAGVPSTVAMQLPISSRAAIVFSEALYRELAAPASVEVAVTAGRLAIAGDRPWSLEWCTPVLFSRAPETLLIDEAREDGSASSNEPAASPARRGRRPVHLGIRTLGPWGASMERDADAVLDLRRHFDERAICEDHLWRSAVFPELRAFLLGGAATGRPLLLDFAAHPSVAFAAGVALEAKSALDITVGQRSPDGTDDWRTEVTEVEPGEVAEGPFWRERIVPGGVPDSGELAVALSVTRPILADVEQYLEREALPIACTLDASVHPEPGQGAVRNGAHALRLAQTFDRRIRSHLLEERRGTVHLFASAPNALLFFLGQLARLYGPVQLYEQDFDSGEEGAYRPALRLPVWT